jgi:hypothetical protein
MPLWLLLVFEGFLTQEGKGVSAGEAGLREQAVEAGI